MKFVEGLLGICCIIGLIWAFPWTPIAYINVKQLIYKEHYKLVEFEIDELKLSCGDVCSASVTGTVNGIKEKMGIGHFYLYEDILPEVLSEILPADAENNFKKGDKIHVYYNPNLSNFTFNSKTARFISIERFQQLTLARTALMLAGIFGPLTFCALGWYMIRTHNKSTQPTGYASD